METLSICAGLITTVLAGSSVVRLIAPGLRRVEKIALGYGLGLAMATMLLFCIFLIGGWFSAKIITACLLVIAALSLFMSGRRRPENDRPMESTPPAPAFSFGDSLITAISITIIVILAVYVVVDGLYRPLSSCDAIYYYDNLANIFFYHKIAALTKNISTIVYLKTSHTTSTVDAYPTHYPYHVPLMHCWLYMLAGNPTVNPKLLHAFYYLSLLTIFYCRARRRTARNTALLGSLAVASAPGVISTVYWAETNFVLTYYLCIGVIYLCDAVDLDKKRLFVLGSVFLSLTLWVRAAGELTLAAITVVMLTATYPKWKYFALRALLITGAIAYAPFKAYALHEFGPPPDYDLRLVQWGRLLHPEPVILLLQKMVWQFGFMSPMDSGIIWPAFFVLAFIGAFRRNGARLLFWCIIALFIAYCLTFHLMFVSTNRPDSAIFILDRDASTYRLLTLFQPIMLFYITLIAGEMGRLGKPRTSERMVK